MPNYKHCPTCDKLMEIEWGDTFDTECYICTEKTWAEHKKEFDKYENLSWWKRIFTRPPTMYYVLKDSYDAKDRIL